MKKILLLIALFSLAGITEAQSSESLLKALVQKGILTEKEADTVREKATVLKTLVQKGILTVKEADLLRVQPINKPQKWEYCVYRYTRVSAGALDKDLESVNVQLPNKLISFNYGDNFNRKAILDRFKKELKKEQIILNPTEEVLEGGTARFFAVHVLNALGERQWEVISHTKLHELPDEKDGVGQVEEIYTLKRPKK